MSILNSIANCRRSLGSGCDREAFYSKKYNLIIKRGWKKYPSSQSWNEHALFHTMDKKFTAIFPVRDTIVKGKEVIILMEKCEPLRELKIVNRQAYDKSFGLSRKSFERWDLLSVAFGLNRDYAVLLNEFCEKYDLYDLHTGNIAKLGDHLVIIDAGMYDAEVNLPMVVNQ